MLLPFTHFYRPMIWGCEKWILSAYPGMESTVTSGPYAGATLSEIVNRFQDQLMGQSLWQRYQGQFPLLFKFIEANQPLSIQVHPTDALAWQQGKGKVGKTEMWYALPCAEDAYLLSGLKHPLTPDTYKAHVADHTIVDDLARYSVHEGDCFFLPAGRIHAIGSGCRLLEVQQSSDVTYRIYDYDRRDAQGHPRELHTELAAQVIDYTVMEDYQTHYTSIPDTPNLLVRCDYFETTLYEVTRSVRLDWTHEDRFLVLVFTSGEGTLQADGESVAVHTGDTILLPATTQHIAADGQLTFLAVTCPL